MFRELEKIYTKYSVELYRYLFSLTHSAADAEDLLSETFLRALRKLPSFREDCSVRTWLYAIARNVWLEFVRKSHSGKYLEDLLEVYLDDNNFDYAAGQILTECIRQKLQQMDARPRNVILLRSEGYSYEEIAEKLQITANSARVIEHRARRKLKEMLLKEGILDE